MLLESRTLACVDEWLARHYGHCWRTLKGGWGRPGIFEGNPSGGNMDGRILRSVYDFQGKQTEKKKQTVEKEEGARERYTERNVDVCINSVYGWQGWRTKERRRG